DASLTVKRLALRAARLAGPEDVIASYGTVLQGLTFYSGRRTVIVGGAGELEFGAREDESRGWILPPKDLHALLEGRTVYMVAPARLASRARDYAGGRLRVLETTASFSLMTNAAAAAPVPP